MAHVLKKTGPYPGIKQEVGAEREAHQTHGSADKEATHASCTNAEERFKVDVQDIVNHAQGPVQTNDAAHANEINETQQGFPCRACSEMDKLKPGEDLLQFLVLPVLVPIELGAGLFAEAESIKGRAQIGEAKDKTNDRAKAQEVDTQTDEAGEPDSASGAIDVLAFLADGGGSRAASHADHVSALRAMA